MDVNVRIINNTCTLVFFVNGKKVEIEDVDPRLTLLSYIRQQLQLTGSKLSCGQGGCGACTVMISEVDRKTSKLCHYTVNACIYPLVCTHGKAVTTVEGIGSTRTVLHPVQERLAKCHGTQCGFCSPGMVMSMYTLLRNTPKPTMSQIEEAVQGNLCRCTGYRPILDSFKTFANDECPLGKTCCRNKVDDNCVPQKLLYDVTSFKSLDDTQELIFPNELQTTGLYDNDSLRFKKDDVYWFRPTTLKDAINIKKSVPNCEWTMGHTIKRVTKESSTISIGHLKELHGINISNEFIEIGAATTLSELQAFSQSENKRKSNYSLTADCLLSTFSNWISGRQIKNVATIGGNILVGSSTSNFIPMLMALRSVAVFTDGDNDYQIKFNNDFGDNMKNRDPHHLMKQILIPLVENEFIGYYCATQQTHIHGRSSIVSTVFRAKIGSNKELLNLSCAFGGILQHSVQYENVSCHRSRQWTRQLIEEYNTWFKDTVKESQDDKEYEYSIALGVFIKFFDDVECFLKKGYTHGLVSQHDGLHHMKGIHVWEPQSDRKSVGKPIPTQWALEHVTGEAKFVMDMPQLKDELYMVLVTSSKSHAKILSVDTTKALAIPGVVDYICSKDIIGKNLLTPGLSEEPIFASKVVTHVGCLIGGIVAETTEAAVEGAACVMIEYEELPAIFTIHEAIERESYLSPPIVIDHGNINDGFNKSAHTLEGEVELGGKDHYYMETQSTVVVPKQEYSQFNVYCSTQDNDGVQKAIASTLGIPMHKINVCCRRVGGAFGGKSTRSLLGALPASIAAQKHNKPVRLSMDRALDMETTGGRHPCYVKYKVGFDYKGMVLAYDCHLFLNGGDTEDFTRWVLREGMISSDNSFHIPNTRITGTACKTHLASNTAFRGFGVPQGIHAINICAERIAKVLNIESRKVFEINFVKDGHLSLTKQVIHNCTIEKCWKILLETSGYVEKKGIIREFNKKYSDKKKGIAITPVKYNLTIASYPHLHQGEALVNIYTDGSVLVHNGGTEVGQGLNIKMIQVASETLGIHHSKVIIDQNTTYIIPNPIVTSGSSATDLYGFAVKNACEKLNKRLESLKDRNPKASWEELVNLAFLERIPLSATGYYKTKGVWFDEEKNEGDISRYSTFGAACSEIELDVVTGDHKLVQVDIVYDIGKSINPAIDIGQIEGAFLQGYGYYCTEELLYSPSGKLLTTGPSTYRVPTVRDIPHQLNITLLKNHPTEKAVYSSKAVGEPPLLLASSAYFAVKDAITSVRLDNGLPEDFQLNSPTSPKRVLYACNH